MEITELQLNDNRGGATSEHNDRDDWSASKENRQGKQNLFLNTILYQSSTITLKYTL